MQSFKETGTTYMDAVKKVKVMYGDRATVLSHKSIRNGGFLGLFQKEGVEIEGYIEDRQNIGNHKFINEKNKIIAAAENKKDYDMKKMAEQIALMCEKIDTLPTANANNEPETIEKIEKFLMENEFSYAFIKKVCSRLKSELTMEQILDFSYVKKVTFEYIKNCLRTYEGINNKINVVVGPTGVGKTTTVAKIAALHSIGIKGESSKKVRIINTDNYRIGANNQIETYAGVMEIPIASVVTLQEFKNKLLLFGEADLILIDTMGRSPNDYEHIAEIRKYLEVCNKGADLFLTVSATTKTEDIKHIYKEFSCMGIDALIITKLDETIKVGNIISAIDEVKMPIVYVTDGQTVPQDINKADIDIFLQKLGIFKEKEILV